MEKSPPQSLGYLLASWLGALVGGILVLIATRAIPKIMAGMMQQMMPKMMQNMREHIKESGCSQDT